MKKKLYLTLALLIALVVTGGTFAYTASVDPENAVSGGNLVKANDAFASVTSSTVTWTDNVTQDTPVDVPSGTIFTVAKSDNYTGSLQVTVYLTNPDKLAECYQFLNMNITASGGSPSTLLLTLENGEVTSTISAASTIALAGGGGHTVLDFGTDAEAEPDLWCEVVPIGADTTVE